MIPSQDALSKLITFLPVLFIGLFGYFIYNKFFNNNPDANKEEKEAIKDTSVNSLGASALAVKRVKSLIEAEKLVINASHVSNANAIEKALMGSGTSWHKIKVLKTMNPSTLRCVFVAYGVRSTELSWHPFNTEGNMLDHLSDDLSESEYAELLPFFKKAKII